MACGPHRALAAACQSSNSIRKDAKSIVRPGARQLEIWPFATSVMRAFGAHPSGESLLQMAVIPLYGAPHDVAAVFGIEDQVALVRIDHELVFDAQRL